MWLHKVIFYAFVAMFCVRLTLSNGTVTLEANVRSVCGPYERAGLAEKMQNW